MITKLRVMRPGHPDEDLEVDLPARPGSMELRRFITPLLDGGDLEHVLVYCGEEAWLGDAGYRDMFVDDEGHGKNLPRNAAATELYLRNVHLHEPWKLDDPDYFIAGPAVLVPERRVWF